MKIGVVLGVGIALVAGPAFAQAGQVLNPPTANVTGPRAVTPGYTTGRYQAANETGKFLEPGNPLQQKAAGLLAVQAGVTCDLLSAAQLNSKHRGGVESVTYEIACKDDFGWILSRVGDKVSAYDCAALAASEKVAKGKLATCRLAENVGSLAGVNALAKKAGLTCKPIKGVFMGGGGEPPISRYEVLCENGSGYIIDAPQPKSTAGMMAMSCARAKVAGMGVCTLKPDKG